MTRPAGAWGWLLDVLIAAAVLTFLALVEFGVVPNMPAGFYCGDPKISYKFTGDTINLATLLVGCTILPLIALWSVEACNSASEDYTVDNPLKRRGLVSLRRMWRWYREYLMGQVFVIFVVEVAKPLVGEPRPHFFDTCKPDMAANCTSGYIPQYTCTNKERSNDSIIDCTRSFPSGHAALSVYMAIFLMLFFQRRVSSSFSYLLAPGLHCLCAVWALCCSLTRITDHRHHWWDVLAGSTLGFATAIFTVRAFCSGLGMVSTKRPAQFRNRSSSLEGAKENGHVITSDSRHHSVRRLLSSTSSYNSSGSPEDKELKEVPVA